MDKLVKAEVLPVEDEHKESPLDIYLKSKGEYPSLFDKFSNGKDKAGVMEVFDSVMRELAKEVDDLQFAKTQCSYDIAGFAFISAKRASILKALAGNELFRKRVMEEKASITTEIIQKILSFFVSQLVVSCKEVKLDDEHISELLKNLKEKINENKQMLLE